MCRFRGYEQLESRLLLAADALATGAIAGSVYFVNEGVGPAPLAAVALTLRDATGMPVATATTDAQGGYLFDQLAPGLYAIDQAQPPGLSDLGVSIGDGGGESLAPNLIGEITVPPDSLLSGYDFYEGPLVQTGEGEPPPLVPHAGVGAGAGAINAFWQLTLPTPMSTPATERLGAFLPPGTLNAPNQASRPAAANLPLGGPSPESSDLATRAARRQAADDADLLEAAVSETAGDVLFDGAVRAARWIEAVWDHFSRWTPPAAATGSSAPEATDRDPLIVGDGQATRERADEPRGEPGAATLAASDAIEAAATATHREPVAAAESHLTVAEQGGAWAGKE